MGVDILSERVTFSGCIPTEIKTHSPVNLTVTNTNSVRRSLFGLVNHQETLSFFTKELSLMEGEKKMKWNFDFAKEKPLKGNFKWQKMENLKPVPSKFLKSPVKIATKSKFTTKRSPLKNRFINRDNVDIRKYNKQTTITDYINKSKTITKNRAENLLSDSNKK